MKKIIITVLLLTVSLVLASPDEQYHIKFDEYFFLGSDGFYSNDQQDNMKIIQSKSKYWIDFNGNPIPLELIESNSEIIVLKQDVVFFGTRIITLFRGTQNVIFSEIALPIPGQRKFIKEQYGVEETAIIKRGKFTKK